MPDADPQRRRSELYDRLTRLTEAQFGEVVLRAGVEPRFLPGANASIADKSATLLGLLEPEGARGYDALDAAIEAVRPLARGAGPAAVVAARPPAIQPPGAGYDPRWYASRPAVEAQLRNCLEFPRMPAIVRGCRGMGRTWLLEHVTHEARATRSARVVDVEFGLLDGADETSFLKSIGEQVAEKCDVPDVFARAWARPSPVPVRLQWLMRECLAADERRLVLVLDVPDAWLAHAGWSQFHNVLNAWNNAGASAPWSRLRLVVTWSTLPDAWGAGAGSPFSVPPIELEDLADDAVDDLALRHGLSGWGADDRAKARSLVGGHPSLLRRLLYALANGATFAKIEERWRLDGGVFREPNLLELVGLLRDNAALRDGFLGVARGGARPTGEVLERLMAAGLVVPAETGASLRYRVYEVLPRLL